jgi:hypothetical protein
MAKSSRSETLRQWLADHRGQVVQIGTKNGAGFLYAGKAGLFTLDALRSAYHAKFDELEVLDVYPSAFVGLIVIIPGAFSGKAQIPLELMPKRMEAPIENYIRFADALGADVVKDYKAALISAAMGKESSEIESTILQAEKFMHSETFSVICPNTTPEELIRIIKKQVLKEVREHEERRRKQAERYGLY